MRGVLELVADPDALGRLQPDPALRRHRDLGPALAPGRATCSTSSACSASTGSSRSTSSFIDHDVLGLIGSYWYAALHYVVTGGGAGLALPAGRAATTSRPAGRWSSARCSAWSAYLLMPTAPPRFISGYVDVLSLHAADGWWGTDASAPRGLGGLTNELAAFPSLHAGWALWVAICGPAPRAAGRGSRPRLGLRRRHRRRHRRHRQPLGHRRGRRLARGARRLGGGQEAAHPRRHRCRARPGSRPPARRRRLRSPSTSSRHCRRRTTTPTEFGLPDLRVSPPATMRPSRVVTARSDESWSFPRPTTAAPSPEKDVSSLPFVR